MLADIIKAQISESGPISVSAFMQLALYHPKYGYYTTQDPFGRGGDFTTAPEISQLFGEMIGLWLADFWMRSGSPKLKLIECGPGKGTLMNDILRSTKNVPELHEKIEVVMVEISPRLKELQQTALKEYHFITWQPYLASIPADRFTIILGNEFLDALPIKQTINGVERKVALDEEGRFCFVGAGIIHEECPALESVAENIARLTNVGGACLFIDYGYSDALPPEGTLQAVKNHHYHPVFEDIGAADITALVDFSALSSHCKKAGMRPLPILTQGLFLERMQIRARHKKLSEKATAKQKTELDSALERLISPEQMGTLFKAFCAVQKQSVTPYGFE